MITLDEALQISELLAEINLLDEIINEDLNEYRLDGAKYESELETCKHSVRKDPDAIKNLILWHKARAEQREAIIANEARRNELVEEYRSLLPN